MSKATKSSLEMEAEEIIRAVKTGEGIDKSILRAFIIQAEAQHEENRKARIKAEAKENPGPIDFF